MSRSKSGEGARGASRRRAASLSRPARLIAIACAIAATTLGGTAGAQSCGPFGDAPATLFASPVPSCFGGSLKGPWNDSDGTPRYACLYEPSSASPTNPLPLVVYLHPSLFTADTLETATNLLAFLDTANLSDNSSKRGFIVLAPEGRNTTHFYPPPDDKGTGWDNWYRQFATDSVKIKGSAFAENVDAAAIDHFIADQVATGKVDTRRIYLTGWSNGAAMGYIYGLNRPAIAAVAVYSAPNPFEAFNDPCPQTPVTGDPTGIRQVQILAPDVPTYQVHNDCDIAGLCPNSELVETQILPLGVSVQDTLINSVQAPTNGCLDACGTDPRGDVSNLLGISLGSVDHDRWPTVWTPQILDFFRRHPLNLR